MHLFITLLTQCYYYELLSPSFFSFLSFQISATTLTNASPITTIVSFFIVFPPFSLGFHSGNRPKEVSIGFLLYNTYCNTYWMFCQCLFLFFSKKFPCMIYAWNHMSMPSRAYTSFLRRFWISGKNPIPRVNALAGLCLISTGLWPWSCHMCSV